jgi:hypothetical protein
VGIEPTIELVDLQLPQVCDDGETAAGVAVRRGSSCGGRLKMIALSLEKDVVRRILQSLGLPCEAPIIARARAPTIFDDPAPADYDAG